MSAFKKMPVLSREVTKKSVNTSDITLFVVHHMKENVVPFIRLLSKSGFKKVVLIGKPYSRDPRFDDTYRKYATVLTPTFEELEHPEYIGKVLKAYLPPKSKCICFDMSGYFSRYFASHRAPKELLGVIEETKNGLWFGKNQTFTFPMLSVASGKLKDYGESYCIARAIARTSEYLLMNAHQRIFTGTNVLILGYGVIGKYLSDLLKDQTCVSVYDISAPTRFKAYVEGHTVLRNLKNLGAYDIIIGVTGHYALKKELLRLKNDVILINGSTGKREFDMKSIANAVKSKQKTDYETVYKLKNGKAIRSLAYGFPVNFFKTESIPEYIFDLVCAEMFVLSQYLVTKHIKPGYYPIETSFPEIEDRLASLWLDYWT